MQQIPRVILLIETSRQFGRGLLQGIANYMQLYGPWTVYREPQELLTKAPGLHRWKANGIIIRGEPVRPKEVIAMGCQAIFCPRKIERVPGFPCMIVDSVTVATMGAEHLLERGFRHFAFCGFSDLPWSVVRRKVFCERVARAGFDSCVYESRETGSQRSWPKEQESIARWLKSLPKPVAIMACMDYRGQHVIEGCKLAGLHVPAEVAVLGVCNDSIICNLCDPPLSSVVLQFEKAGYEAAETLDKMMSGRKVACDTTISIVPSHVVTRQSTDILAIEDHAVAEAVRFIRENSKASIQVDEVVASASVSRRALEQRFRKVIGRSLNDEIRRTRVERVARALLETNRTVAQIAMDLGYPGIDHIARYFRAEKGMSPVAFRRKYRI